MNTEHYSCICMCRHEHVGRALFRRKADIAGCWPLCAVSNGLMVCTASRHRYRSPILRAPLFPSSISFTPTRKVLVSLSPFFDLISPFRKWILKRFSVCTNVFTFHLSSVGDTWSPPPPPDKSLVFYFS